MRLRIWRILSALAIVFALVGSAFGDTVDGSLVAWYRFEEGSGGVIKDWSGHGNEGKIVGKADYVKLDGDRGHALRFADGKAYVDCGNSPSLDLKDAVTLELWFRPETGPSGGTEAGLLGTGIGSFALTYVAGGGCWWYIGGGGNGVSGGGVPPTSAWRHLAATFDGKESKIYIDGELAGSRALEQSKITSGGPFYLRYPLLYGSDKVLPFTCMMDDVRVYNRALTADELLRHFKGERNWRQGRNVAAGEIRVAPRVYSAVSRLRVEADIAGLQPIPEGSAVSVEVVQPKTGKVLLKRQTRELPSSDIFVAIFDISKARPGSYQIRTAVRDKSGKQVGRGSVVRVTLPQAKAPRPQPKGARSLNNLVTELLNVQNPKSVKHQRYRFTNPRDGWVFVSSSAKVSGGGSVSLVVNPGNKKDVVIAHQQGGPATLEAMRYLAAGEHTLDVDCKGTASQTRLVVRSIPEILYAEVCYSPSTFLPGFGVYNWDFLKRIGLLDNLNVILERHDEAPAQAAQWREEGKKVLTYSNLYSLGSNTADAAYDYWSKLDGFRRPDRDGIMFDELSGDSNLTAFPGLSGGVRKLSVNPAYREKALYPYCTFLYTSEPATTFAWEIAEAGYKLAEEVYLQEQPTEAAARKFLNSSLTQRMAHYRKAIPNAPERMIVNLGYMSAPPETLNSDPSADYKVYLEMQFNLLANDPAFRGLYGMMCYHSAYADEETIRWSAKLFRHYCIEGKKDMLSKDPYILTHVKNPDFAQGTTGWTLSQAEPGSMDVKSVPGYSYLEGRYPTTSQGDTVLWTRRSAKGPNRFEQEVKDLVPGKLYSLKMFTADYQRFVSGNGVPSFAAVPAKRDMSIGISDVDLVGSKSFENTYASGICGHTGKGFTRDNNLPITYSFVVFRAKSGTAKLTVSDWASDTDPGGPIGEELMHNFIEVQPFLED